MDVLATAKSSRPASRLPRLTSSSILVLLLLAAITTLAAVPPKRGTPKQAQQEKRTEGPKESEQNSTEDLHTYLHENMKQLIKQVSDLKNIRPAESQEELPKILKNTGKKVDEFFDSAVDLVADEEIKQERTSSFGSASGSKPVRDSYLILRHGDGTDMDFEEFRMDGHGNRLDRVGMERGFLVTSGFALICSHFSTAFQRDSIFRYLGDEKVDKRETYVVAFAQLPDKATFTETLVGPRGTASQMLVQGIAWIDQENYHILRMRTDLLERHPEVDLEEQTTKVDFREVQLADVPAPLWLPHDVTVFLKMQEMNYPHVERAFQNVHRYSNYRRYRVAVKMVTPQ